MVMIGVILAHIYIGWLGMEGAYDAMGRGYVDENWARQHHPLWLEELEAKGERTARGCPHDEISAGAAGTGEVAS